MNDMLCFWTSETSPEATARDENVCAPNSISSIVAMPITVNTISAHLNTFFAPLKSLSATLSDTIFEIAVGSPAEDMTSNVE